MGRHTHPFGSGLRLLAPECQGSNENVTGHTRRPPPRLSSAGAASVRVEPLVRHGDIRARAPTSRPAIQTLLALSGTPSAYLHSENLPFHTPDIPHHARAIE